MDSWKKKGGLGSLRERKWANAEGSEGNFSDSWRIWHFRLA